MIRFVTPAVLLAIAAPAFAQSLPDPVQRGRVDRRAPALHQARGSVLDRRRAGGPSSGAIKAQIKPFTELGFMTRGVLPDLAGHAQLHACNCSSAGADQRGRGSRGPHRLDGGAAKLLSVFRPHLAAEFERKHNLKLL
ncbi:MAG: hypothetical protein M5U07_20820, partial [Xanthobacteraceae bacterium]|nr:hypothetical protein [Xanthobacteraceae bacterium]